MRLHFLLIGSLLLLGPGLAAPMGCGSSGSGGTGGSTAITRRCVDIYVVGDPCDPCLQQHCCDELSACDSDCLDCLRGASSCGTTSDAVFKCGDKSCLDECSGHSTTSGAGGTAGAGGK
jgi:hypothetical protein